MSLKFNYGINIYHKPTPFSLANASFCFFRSKRRVFAFRQGGFVGSGPAPGSREENEWNKMKLLVVITISVLKLKKWQHYSL